MGATLHVDLLDRFGADRRLVSASVSVAPGASSNTGGCFLASRVGR
jgi:hypothetical protein